MQKNSPKMRDRNYKIEMVITMYCNFFLFISLLHLHYKFVYRKLPILYRDLYVLYDYDTHATFPHTTCSTLYH